MTAPNDSNPPTASPSNADGESPGQDQPTGPAPTLLLLIRHGVTASTGKVLYGRSPGVHLSPDGQKQAEDAGARLAGLGKVTAVYASPLDRTIETATPIATATGQSIIEEPALLEADFGDWTNRELSDLFKDPSWPLVQNKPSSFRFPNGESFVEMQSRMISAAERLVAAHPGERIAIVSHADPIKALIAHFTGVHLDLFQRIVISPCSISPVLITTSGPVVLAVNSTGDDLTRLAPA